MKDIEGFEGRYAITEDGRVWSHEKKWTVGEHNKNTIQTQKPRWLKLRKNRYGYLTVTLRQDGLVYYPTVHKLVAEAFITNPNNYPCINHKDSDRTNNLVQNLEWCTYKQNGEHMVSVGHSLRGTKNAFSKLTNEKVLDIKSRINNGESRRKLAKEYDVAYSTTTRIANGTVWGWLT